MTAVAAYLLDGYPPPPELAQAMDCRAWGVDITRLQAGLLPTLNAAYNAHSAISGWQRGGTKWVDANPKGWEFVSSLLLERRNQRKAGTWPESKT